MSVQSPEVHTVAEYAAAVRRALAGLGPEQVDDLTDGLEADLAEALADAPAGRGADPVSLFGTPEEYAAELGAAAGLTPGAPSEGRRPRLPGWVRHPVRALTRRGERVLATLRQEDWWPPVESFLVALRPVWWVLRAWAIYQIPMRLFNPFGAEWMPHDLLGVLALGVLVVASVQWGRGRWRLPRYWRGAALVVSAIAAVAVVPLLAGRPMGTIQYVYNDVPVESQPQDGVVVDGMAVSNLFVYDSEGNPLDGVQIFDDRGRPVRTTYDEGQAQWYMPGDDMPWQFVGAQDEEGRVRWNVYPLYGAHADAYVYDEATGQMVLPDPGKAKLPPRPFAKAPAIVGPDGAGDRAERGATGTATTGPGATPTPNPAPTGDGPTGTPPPDGSGGPAAGGVPSEPDADTETADTAGGAGTS